MEKHPIGKVAVLGAGVMGAQIAAHFVNAGFETLLYDLRVEGADPNRQIKVALDRLTKLKPPPLGSNELVRFIEPANYDQNLALLHQCDLIIEAIAEKLDWKESLYLKVLPHLHDKAILASNTSGLSIKALAKGLPEDLQERFCGIHFFNPPRYMKLVELTGSPKTRKTILNDLESFLTSFLGKTVIRTKDTPNFIANRIGVFSILITFYHMERLGLGFDEVDALTGPLIGRAKSATFRTIDVVGLDTMARVIDTMTEDLKDDPWHDYFQNPAWLKMLVTQGAIGQKAGKGFYKKSGKTIEVLDLKTMTYHPGTAEVDPNVKEILAIQDPKMRFEKLMNSKHPQAEFVWSILKDLFHYAAFHAAEIAHSVRDIDIAMRLGFGWQQGPFEIWQAAGFEDLAEKISNPLPVYQKQLFPLLLLNETVDLGHTMFENSGVRLWDQGDDIAILSFKTKNNTINAEVISGINHGVNYAENHARGLIIWQEQGDNFSYGADLKYFTKILDENPTEGEAAIHDFQRMCLNMRYAKVPVVVALKGLVLGGGCELALHADARVAAFETYMGLVEAGVGLLPAGGGTKEFALKASLLQPQDLLLKLKGYFRQIAMAEVSSSAIDAKNRGFLTPCDQIVMNSDEILYSAKKIIESLGMNDYKPPFKPYIQLAGKPGIAQFKTELLNLREGHFISDYDYFLGGTIANVICGDEVEAGSIVDEEWLLTLERKAFMTLMAEKKTRERIKYTLETGKPLRN